MTPNDAMALMDSLPEPPAVLADHPKYLDPSLEYGSPEYIAALAALLGRYRRAYYNSVPLVSDKSYDLLEDRLRALAPEHPLLQKVGEVCQP